MESTEGSILKIKKDYGFSPKVQMAEGIKKFVNGREISMKYKSLLITGGTGSWQELCWLVD